MKITVGGVPRVVDLARPPALTNVTALSETSGYLPNPGMGYQGWTHDIASSLDTAVEYRRGNHAEQGGFDWATLNPSAGTYNWAPVDNLLAACAARGERGSFRVLTMLGDSFGGHLMPAWVVSAGAVVLAGSEPDYRARAYQQHWGTFVDALAARYDGDPRIAFIDISGYGKFNEWQAYAFTDNTGADFEGTGTSIDASTRRHLVHMFVGGTGTAGVVESNGTTAGTLAYSHPGFQATQLIMTYGGIWASTRYVAANYPHVGFRNDALMGSDAELADFVAIGYGVTDIWRSAPVIFEPISGALKANYPAAATAMQGMGAAFLHDNSLPNDSDLAPLVAPVGYRYHCSQIRTYATTPAGLALPVETTWTNRGYAKAYPRMGQDFAVALALANTGGAVVGSWTAEHGVDGWLPGIPQVALDYVTAPAVAGTYTVLVGIVDRTTSTRILLPLAAGGRTDRWYPAGTVTVT